MYKMPLNIRLLLNALKSKVMLCFILLLFIFALIYIKNSRVQDIDFEFNSISVVSQIFSTLLNENIVMLLFIPAFLICILQFVSILFKNNILLKFSQIKNWWNKVNLLMMMFSFIFTLIIFFFLIVLTFYSGISFLESSGLFLSLYVFSGLLLCIGLFVVGQVCVITVLFFRKTYWGFITPILFFLGSNGLQSILGAKWFTVGQYITSSYKFFNKSLIIYTSDIIVILLFSVVSTILYWLGRSILQDKDFFGDER